MSKTLSLRTPFAGLSFSAPVVPIIPSIGPSGNPPTYNTYNQNALGTLKTNVTSFGLGPGGYNRLTGAFNPAHIVDTFLFSNSWLGIASPASPFDTGYGNNLYSGVRVEGFGAGGATSFALNDFIFTDTLIREAPQTRFSSTPPGTPTTACSSLAFNTDPMVLPAAVMTSSCRRARTAISL